MHEWLPAVILILFCIESAVVLFNIFSSISWLHRQAARPAVALSAKQPCYLLIPVFQEAEMIGDSFHHFVKIANQVPDVRVVFITTARENSENGQPTTSAILQQLLAAHPDVPVSCVHYPFTHGVMAHQLNYAISELRQEIQKESALIGIYNVDSVIDADAIRWIVSHYRSKADSPCVYQQYGYYRNMYLSGKPGWMSSACLWQNRWALGFELGRLRNDTFWKKRCGRTGEFIYRLLFRKMNYVIGHGLFFDYSTYQMAGTFPEHTVNEDAYWGLCLHLQSIPIVPVPYLESSLFTNRLPVYIRQQSTWFNGPFHAFRYYQDYRSTHPELTIGQQFELLTACFRLYLHALYWLLSPVLLVLAMAIAFFTSSTAAIVLAIVAPLIYLWLPNVWMSYWLRRKKIGPEYNSPLPRASLVHDIPFYLLHTLGPFWNIMKSLSGKNTIAHKYKTEKKPG